MTDKYLGDIKKCIATFHLSSKKTPAGKMAAALFNKEDGYSVQEDKLSNSAIVSHKGTTEAQVYML